jgi:hypothetical protein
MMSTPPSIVNCARSFASSLLAAVPVGSSRFQLEGVALVQEALREHAAQLGLVGG